MIYHLLALLHKWFPATFAVNPFQFITFRTAVSFVVALLFSLAVGPRVIAMLRALKAGQPIRTVTIEGAPNLADMHGQKAGTPTMGGVLILAAIVIPTVLFCDLFNPFVWLLLVVTCGYGLLGFLDDYLKVAKKNADGLLPRYKILGQVCLGLVVGLYLYLYGERLGVEYSYVSGGQASEVIRGYEYLLVPFFKQYYLHLGLLLVPFVILVLTSTSNTVNLTDGLDGLCIGTMTIVGLAFAILTYIASNRIYSGYLMVPYVREADEVVVFMGAFIGACLGFLWFNAHPAEVFMGDTGSLSLGAIIGTVALITKQELLLVIIGGIFVVEGMSVIIQVASFKLRGKRVFLMAPIHHHFEKMGVPESKIIARFWIVCILLAMAGLSSLKLR